MALEKLNENLSIIQNLGDNPNSDNNLSAELLKMKFDEAAKIIQQYLNGQVVPFVNELDATFSSNIDPTLTSEVKAAQAKATGDEIRKRLPLAGGTMEGSIAMGGNKITGLVTPTDDADAATKAYADAMLPKSGGTMSGALTMDGNKITGLGTPTEDLDAVTKEYVDDTFTEMKILWTNSSTSSSFSAQTILNNGELSGYNVVIILFHYDVNNARKLPAFVCNVGASNGGYASGINPSDKNIVGRTVQSVKSDAGIVFASGYNNGSSDNKACIPYRVYGIQY